MFYLKIHLLQLLEIGLFSFVILLGVTNYFPGNNLSTKKVDIIKSHLYI